MRKTLSQRLQEGHIGLDDEDAEKLKAWEKLPEQALQDVAGGLSRRYGHSASEVMEQLQKQAQPHAFLILSICDSQL